MLNFKLKFCLKFFLYENETFKHRLYQRVIVYCMFIEMTFNLQNISHSK